MKTRSLLICLKPILILLGVGYFQASHGDTRSYAATTDFPITDAGLVPYYSEAPGRPSLAINAANENYRDLFARAEVVYDGNEGVHDITIVALAELDGEADYRLLVNGELVGTATNPEVIVDYTVVRHTFPDITVPVGALLGVESLANTNGNIPEGDGTAFARGRWTTLELLETDTANEPAVFAPNNIDLSLLITSNPTSIYQNEPFQLDVTVANAASSLTATQPQVTISIPPEAISVISADQCAQTNFGLTCAFPELPAGVSNTMSLSLSSTDETLTLAVQAYASADQGDRDETNNMANLNINVSDSQVEIGPEEPVDPGTIVQAAPMVSSGGGGLSLYWLLLLLPAKLLPRKRQSIN